MLNNSQNTSVFTQHAYDAKRLRVVKLQVFIWLQYTYAML